MQAPEETPSLPREVVPDELPAPLRDDPHPGFLRDVLHGLYGLCWYAAALIGSPLLLWRSLRRPGFAGMVADRCGRGLADQVGKHRSRGRRVLIHGVSVGEVKGAQPIVRGLEESYPDLDVAVSVTTDTGTELARKLFPDNLVVRFPVDLARVVRRFLRTVRPDFVVLIELEIWPNFLRECNRMGIPVVVINGRITDKSHAQYHLFRNLLPQFDRISLYCAQAEEYADRFLRLGVDPDRLIVTGNIKADGLSIGAVDAGEELTRLLGARDRLCLVAGSTHGPEELFLVRAWKQACPQARLILVPRHPNRSAEVVQSIRDEFGFEPQLLSKLREGEAPDPLRPALVDTIGELERVYALADLVFIGGSLIPHGGQNMLEPAAQGKAVVYGPHVTNFVQEAQLLEAAGAARRVEGVPELVRSIEELSGDGAARETMGAAGRAAAAAQKGASRWTLLALERLGVGGASRPSRPGGDVHG